MMFHDLSEDDKLICFQLLQGVENTFTSIWQSHKEKRFEDIYPEEVAEPVAKEKKKWVRKIVWLNLADVILSILKLRSDSVWN